MDAAVDVVVRVCLAGIGHGLELGMKYLSGLGGIEAAKEGEGLVAVSLRPWSLWLQWPRLSVVGEEKIQL
jgi:hypothetical protein